MGNQHIIQKQVLEVEMQNCTDAFVFRRRLGEIYHDKILPALEKLFDECSKENELVRLEEVSIDLGNIAAKNWEEDLLQRCLAEVTTVLSQTKASPVIVSADARKVSETFVYDKSLPSGTSQQIAEIFFYFLQTGNLPWYVNGDIRVMEELNKWLSAPFSSFNSFHDFIRASSLSSRLRLVYQCDDATLEKLILVLLREEERLFWRDVLLAKEMVYQQLFSHNIDRQKVRNILYLPVFNWLAQQTVQAFGREYIRGFLEMITRVTSNNRKMVGEVITIFTKHNHQQTRKKHTANLFFTGLAQATTEAGSLTGETQKDFEKSKNECQPESNDELFVANAGLVLLHPFLARLFASMGILDEHGIFINEDAQMKAVLATHYLTTGEAEAEEHLLILNKIICGVDVNQPVLKQVLYTPGNIAEMENLLNQVIGLWVRNNVQVNQTTEGLRSSFLQRNGKLTRKNNDWHLLVEQRSYDLVLSSLPWGFSMIKNNWMPGMLWVDWA